MWSPSWWIPAFAGRQRIEVETYQFPRLIAHFVRELAGSAKPVAHALSAREVEEEAQEGASKNRI